MTRRTDTMAPESQAFRTPSRPVLRSSPQYATPNTPYYSDQEPEWTPSRRAIPSNVSGRPRTPHEKRARKIFPTGVVDAEGRPLPSDPSKPCTLLTLEEIYAIAREGDRSVMRDYGELFITTGINSYETKAEYAWIYIRPNDLGQLPLPEERLRDIFPEWEMVMEFAKESSGSVDSGSQQSQKTWINLLSPSKNDSGPDAPLFYRTVESSGEKPKPTDEESLHKEVWDLRTENYILQREVQLMHKQQQKVSSELRQARTQILAHSSPVLPHGKRGSETAFGMTDGYGDGSGAGRSFLHSGSDTLGLLDCPSDLNDLPSDENMEFNSGDSKERETKRRATLNQQVVTGNKPESLISVCIAEAERTRIVESVGTDEDIAKLKLHGSGHFTPYSVAKYPSLAMVSPSEMPAMFNSPQMYGSVEFQDVRYPVRMPGHPYPGVNDQPRVDTQIMNELGAARSLTGPMSTDRVDRNIDPALFPSPHGGYDASQDPNAFMDQFINYSPPPELPQQASSRSTPSKPRDISFNRGLKIKDKWKMALQDPKLALDPIQKFYTDLNDHPPGLPKRYGNYLVQSDLPLHLQHLRPEDPFDPATQVLSNVDIRLLFDFGPSIRGRFEMHFKRRDGYVKQDFRWMMDEVDPVSGEFRLSSLHLYGLDPQFLPHYINRHYPEFRLLTAVRCHRRKEADAEEFEDDEDYED